MLVPYATYVLCHFEIGIDFQFRDYTNHSMITKGTVATVFSLPSSFIRTKCVVNVIPLAMAAAR